MSMQLLFPILLMALGLGYSMYVLRRRSAGMPEAFRMFFERTGYRYADIYDRPLEEHIMHGKALMANARHGYKVHMLRDYYGLPVHSLQETSYRREGLSQVTSISGSWVAPLPRQPRIFLQIAERSLSGFGKGLREVFSSSERVWEPAYPLQVASGDPEIDRRFQIYGHDPAAVQSVLFAPGLKELLLGCAEVDLCVYADRIVFADPTQKNMTSGMGGTIGMMAMGTNMMKWMEMTIPVHDRIAQILGTVARACV